MKKQIIALYFSLAIAACAANLEDTGWTSWTQLAGRSPTNGAMAALPAPLLEPGDLDSADEVTPELQALADALDRDPLRIYEWVKNNIDFYPYSGLKRGAHLAYLERAGNDFDTCALLVALLRASGHTQVKYRFGVLLIPLERSDHHDAVTWLSAQRANVRDVLVGSGSNYPDSGFPNIEYSGSNHLRKPHLWVSLTKNGQTYVLDPSFKPYKKYSPVVLDDAAVSNYSTTGLLNAAGGDASEAHRYWMGSSGLSGLRSKLTDYTVGLVNYARNTAHSKGAAELIGTRELDVQVWSQLPSAFPDGFSVDSSYSVMEWDEIPKAYGVNVVIQLGPQNDFKLNHTIYLSDLKGDKINLWFEADKRARIYIGDSASAIAEEAGGLSTTAPVAVTYTIRFPNTLGNFTNRGVPLDRNGSYVVLYGFDSTAGRLQNRLKKQAALVDANVSPDGRQLRGENLYIIGLQHIVQSNAFYSIMEAQSNHMNHLGSVVGVIGYANGAPYLDLPMRIMLIAPRNNLAVDINKMLLANSYWGSAMEHIALEQTNPSPCVSTIKMINYAVENNHSVYLASQGNYFSVIGQLSNYNNTYIDTNSIQTAVVNNNGKALLIQDQAMLYGQFRGNGYMLMQQVGNAIGIRMGISGGLAGGFSTQRNNLHNTPFSHNWGSAPNLSSFTPPVQPPTYFGDPVDASNGSFYKEDTDLTLGDSSPHGLALVRQYSSSRNLLDPAKLGKGWTHNYYMKIAYRHPNDMDVRKASVAEVAPLMVTCRVILDLVNPAGTARDWVIPAVTASWAGDQMVNSRVSVAMGPKGIEFIKLPDGTFAPPAGVAATLTKESDGKHKLKFRKGLEILFRATDASNAAGRFESITDKNNSAATAHSATATYSGDLLSRVTDSYGRWFDFTYTSGVLTKVSDSTGREVNYSTTSEYFQVKDVLENTTRLYKNEKNLITKLTDALNRSIISFTYDTEERVVTQKAFDHNNYLWHYGFAPGVAREKDPAGNTKYTYFDGRGRKVIAIDQAGARSDWIYDGNDRVVGTVSGEGEETFTQYNKNHEVIWVKNEAADERAITPSNDASSTNLVDNSFEGKVTTTKFTSYHKPKEVILPGSIVATYDYDTRGRLKEVHPASYAAGKKITYSYEDDPYTKRIVGTFPDETKEIADYNARGDLIASIDRRGSKVTYEYNLARQRTKTHRWSGNYDESSPRSAPLPATGVITTEAEYDANGYLKAVADEEGNRVEYEYDAQGNLVESTGPDGQPTASYIYNSRNLLEASLDAIGSPTKLYYNNVQKLEKVTDVLNRDRTTGYDKDGRLTSVKTALNFETTTQRDTANRKHITTDPLGNNSSYTRDKDGRLKTFKNRRNHDFTWEYDDTNRKVITKTPLLKTTTTEANTRGLTISIEEPSTQTTTFSLFDDEGRVKKRTDGDNVETQFDYWAGGSLKSVTEGTKSSQRTYDDFGRLKEYKDDEDNVIKYDYYDTGKLQKLTYPGGAFWVEYFYDSYGRVEKLKDTANRETTFTYDTVGNIKRITRHNGTFRTFVYDAAGQVLQIEERKSNQEIIWFQAFKYDGDGRPNWSFKLPVPQSYTVASDSVVYDADNRISTFNGLSVIHDADGNMTTGPSPEDTSINRSYVYDARNRLKSMNGVSYGYNVDGARVSVGSTKYVIDPNADLNRVFVRKIGSETTYYVWGLGLSYEVNGTASTVYHVNHQGSTVALSNDSGTVTDRVEYAPFGKVTYRSGTTNTPFLLHGAFGVMTDSNGLVYMKARYYHPALKRFVNADQTGFGGGSNWYAFAGNSPMLLLDPTGQDAAGRFRNAAAGASGGFVGGFIGGAVSGALIGVAGGGVGALPGAFIGAIAGALNGAFGGAISGALADPNADSGDISWGAAVDGAVWSPLAAFGGIASYSSIAAQSGTARALRLPATDSAIAGTETLGYTTRDGRVFLSPGLSRADQVATMRHESVHAWFTPRGNSPIATFRQDVAQWGYDNSQLLRFAEEVIAETYASGSLLQGIRHPLMNGYGITAGGLLLEGGLLGGSAYLLGSE